MKWKGELRTIYWDSRRKEVVMIDQTALPERLRYVRCRNYREVGEAIRKMIVRGAPAIGVAAAMGLALCAVKQRTKSREKLLKELEKAADYLSKTRPTAVNLFWAIERVMGKVRNTDADADTIRDIVLQEAQNMAEEDVRVNKQIGKIGAQLFEDGDRVLTLCK